MTKLKRNVTICVTAIMLILLIAFSAIPRQTVVSYAANTDINFDETYVIDDLKNSVIDGKDYSLAENNFFADYNFDSKKEIQLFSFVEYCYSFYENLQGNYALYAYVYNPKGIKFAADSSLNKITMRVGNNKSSEYKKYSLLYLNQCTEQNYEGLFYKYKVLLSTVERQRILETVNSTERLYSISEIELQTQGAGAESYYVSTDYYYSGYSAGYGANANAESTLTIKSEQADSLSLDVHPAVYRPNGTNGKNNYTQDSLHSVYFSVPNEYIKQYGEMVAVHATWLNAVTNWGLVVGNINAYRSLSSYIAQDITKTWSGGMENGSDKSTSAVSYAYVGNYSRKMMGDEYGIKGDFAYNVYWNAMVEVMTEITTLHYLFYSGEGANSADTYTVTSEEMFLWLKNYTMEHGGELVNNKYSKSLFESVDNEFTEVNWDYKKSFSISSQKIGQTFWEKLWGQSHIEFNDTFDNISAIHKVKADDFISTDEVNAEKLYVSSMNYTDLKKFYDTETTAEKDSTVYLFRYMVSDYISEEATEMTKGAHNENTNAYFFKETVNLDFDIIDVTFSNGEINTVIPVVMSPIDIIHAVTPPVYTTDDTKKDWLKIILGIILLVLLLVLLQVTGILPLVINLIVWVITAPFKAVAALFRSIKKTFTKKDGT